jgi:hypothetical protein
MQGKRGMVRLEYLGSFYSNDASVLRWTNPFSDIDQSATNNEPPLPPVPAPPNAAGGFNRWRFSTGQLQLPPDNRAHTVVVTARIGLPASSFAGASFSYSKRLQDQQFLPFTLNAAICGATPNVCPPLPAGVSPTSLAALPRQNLGGDVDVINGDLVVGTRQWKTVLLTARYRNYRFDNNTPAVELPGYAGYGEALWRSTIGGYAPSGATFNFPVAELNNPLSYARQQASIEAVWRPTTAFQLKVTPTWEAWNREHREVNRTNDWGGRTQVIYGPRKWFNARVEYRYANREPQSRVPNELEFPGKWNFDTRHRITHDSGIVLNLVSTGPWLISARYQYLSNAYGLGFFGLNRYLQGTAGADVNYIISDRIALVAYYNHDRIAYRYRQNAKGGGATAAAQFNPRNEWDRHTRDVADSVGVGVNANALTQRLEFSANYDVSLARQRFITFNPSTPLPSEQGAATARPWPDTSADYHELRLDSNYRIARSMRLGIRYLFQPFRLDDFAWDIMQPNMFGIAAQPDTDPRRFTFLNARYDSYDAHMLGFYLRYTF